MGVLGCMAERLKTSLLEEESVDFVCGPDAYRDIPLLVDIATSTGCSLKLYLIVNRECTSLMYLHH